VCPVGIPVNAEKQINRLLIQERPTCVFCSDPWPSASLEKVREQWLSVVFVTLRCRRDQSKKNGTYWQRIPTTVSLVNTL
jgi:hypothetical protein